MIRRLADNLTLFRQLPNGTTQYAGPRDGDVFIEMDTILDAQTQAGVVNQQTMDKYKADLNLFQVNLDGKGAAIAGTPPSLPLALVVDDFGRESHAPFDPSLPLPVYPHITPSSLTAIPVSSTPAPNQDDAILAYLKSINGKLDKLLLPKV